MNETRYYYIYNSSLILIWCYLEPLQIVAELWQEWDIFDKVAQYHRPGLIVQAEAHTTISITLSRGWTDSSYQETVIDFAFVSTSTVGW